MATVTATYTLSEAPVTTMAQSFSEGANASPDLGAQLGTETGTLTDVTRLSSPSTVTTTDSGVVTEGACDVISSGTSSDSLYETSENSQSVDETGILTSTQTGTLNETNSSDTGTGSMTTTSTLNDTANTTLDGPTTETQTESLTLGFNATVAGGSANSTLWSSASESYSLYETGDETYSSGSTQTQGTTETY